MPAAYPHHPQHHPAAASGPSHLPTVPRRGHIPGAPPLQQLYDEPDDLSGEYDLSPDLSPDAFADALNVAKNSALDTLVEALSHRTIDGVPTREALFAAARILSLSAHFDRTLNPAAAAAHAPHTFRAPAPTLPPPPLRGSVASSLPSSPPPPSSLPSPPLPTRHSPLASSPPFAPSLDLRPRLAPPPRPKPAAPAIPNLPHNPTGARPLPNLPQRESGGTAAGAGSGLPTAFPTSSSSRIPPQSRTAPSPSSSPPPDPKSPIQNPNSAKQPRADPFATTGLLARVGAAA